MTAISRQIALVATAALIFLVGTAPAAEHPTAVVAPAVETIDDLLAALDPWVVSIRVERDADEKGPFDGARQRGARGATPEVVNYFQRPKGLVTGLLVDRDGHILTTRYNVVGKLRSIEVVLASGEVASARLLGVSLPDDIALLRLETPPEFPDVHGDGPPWAEESSRRPGQIVFALGRSPDPSRLTMTRGIVSAIKRNAGRALQTDAELNYGNVGGPIVNLDGDVVAIAAFVGHTHPQWGVNSGIGFGTRVRSIRRILPRLKKGDVVHWAFLGVKQMPGDAARDAETKGCLISDLQEGGAAEAAGLKSGDLILEFDGTALENFADLRRIIYSFNAFDQVVLKVRRGKDVVDVKVTLGEILLQ